MLELCREYSEADWLDAEAWTYEEKIHNTLCQEVRFGGWFSTYLSYVGVYGREYPVYGYPTLSGQVYEVVACSDSCAIYSGSSQKEGAWTFIESLLWESNQNYRGIVEPGFPVRSSILEELAEEAKSEKLRANGEMLTMTEARSRFWKISFTTGNCATVCSIPTSSRWLLRKRRFTFTEIKVHGMWPISYRARQSSFCRNEI